MNKISGWVRRRRWTLTLAIFFCVWYALQLSTSQLFGRDVAKWWFYFEQPPDVLSPGLVLAPISHDMNTLTHLGANLLFLIFAGGLSEPYIGRNQVLTHVIGIGYLGLYVANSTIHLHQMWIIAGTSGGILSLWAYAGLRMHKVAAGRISEGLVWSRRGAETVGAVCLLIGIPVFILQETLWTDQIHSGHSIGILLGCIYYAVEAYFGSIDTEQPSN